MSDEYQPPTYRGMRSLGADDYQLSMRISPRARRDEDNDGLRALLVHRLDDTLKAIWRRALRRDTAAAYCEPCRKWADVKADHIPYEWRCPRCQRLYEIEFAVYAEVKE